MSQPRLACKGQPGHDRRTAPEIGRRACRDAGGRLAVRIGKQFKAARKLGKTHQNILVFCKGDPRKATDAIEGRTK